MKILVGVIYTLLPEIVLLISAVLMAHYAIYFPNAGVLATELVSLFILLVSLALSIQFNRSRMFFALLTLLMGFGALLAIAGNSDNLSKQILGGSLCLFMPLNLVCMHPLEERGIFTRYGIWPFGLLLLEIVFTMVLMGTRAHSVADALFAKFIQWPIFTGTAISQPGMLLLFIGILWINDRLIRQHSAEIAAFFFAMLATAVMLGSRQPVTVAIFAAASALAFGVAIVLESWSMAYLDELTGVPGRRALEEHMRQLGGRYVIAMLDVDHFKNFNDTYGHDMGDQVLRLVASRLQQSAGGGKAFRYGGEEFGLLYPGKNLKEIVPILEDLRSDIESSGFNTRRGERRAAPGIQDTVDDDNPLRVTVSIGAAENSVSRGDPWGVLKNADQALYDAKHNGRNQVCIHEL
ncbi:MAG TPA: GGDEF domain-containing protein [Gammaproteobacteria bacterium]|nr:GGDEF domain-containing protein [Gammaproteobacteria bacterium]